LRIALACDHGGFHLKEEIKLFLQEQNYQFRDFGVNSDASVDYPDLVIPVAQGVMEGEFQRGILLCGTGIGISIVANKFPGIRAALCGDTFSARASREHNDANILVLGGRILGPGLAREITQIWLNTEFEGGRHVQRLDKIRALEEKYCCKV
jgi:ribose 5-phosphate isomerase B